MAPRATAASSLRQLPPCPGPKLKRFHDYRAQIEWLERLDTDREGDIAAEGYVFRARIGTGEFAIKVFKFYNPLSSADFWKLILGDDYPLKRAAYYTDPFFSECRAYGKINEAIELQRLEADIVVPCHGFLFLNDRDEDILNDRGVDFGLDNINFDYQTGAEGGFRVRAIVKDLAPGADGLGSGKRQGPRKALKRIKDLNKKHIYNRDVRLENFKDGRLVDFGSSWTRPHAIMDALQDQALKRTKTTDLIRFDDMVEREKIKTRVKAMPNSKYRKRLRSSVG